ncbi:hypothetical protein Pen01_25210 [Phytomonospora endophytica]|nr:hypothetical protein Pen01_25210 [Phytomonospora endophytica]
MRFLPPPSLVPAPGGYLVEDFIDEEDLKYRIASDPTVIARLASLADTLGYGWCGGTQYGRVGQGFDVSRGDPVAVTPGGGTVVGKEAPFYVAKARFSPDDLYVEGPNENDRLKITLHDFRLLIDPKTFGYGEPLIEGIEPAAVAFHTAENLSAGEDSSPVEFTYQLATTTTHTTTRSFTEGVKVGFSIKSPAGEKLLLGFEISANLEISFQAEQGWSDSEATTHTDWLKHGYTAKMPGRTRRRLTLVAARTRARVDYTAEAVLSFDVRFDGFLRGTGNAHVDHSDQRPHFQAVFGTTEHDGPEHITDLYDHRHIPGYSVWDWAWAEAHNAPALASAMEFLRAEIRVPLSGRFTKVWGTSVSVVAGPEESLDSPPRPDPDGTVPGRWEHVPLGTPAADIAVGADGTAWAVATDESVHRRDPAGGPWRHVPEARARRITVGAGGVAWVVNAGGGVNRLVPDGTGVHNVMPPADSGAGWLDSAADIAAGGDAVWILAGADTGGNRPLLRWSGTTWTPANISGAAVAASADGTAWISDAAGALSSLNAGAVSSKPNGARDLGVASGTSATVWAVDPATAGVRRLDGGGWKPAPPGDAVRVAVAPDGTPWRIDAKGEIHRLVAA